MSGVTHTIEREVREVSRDGSVFTYSFSFQNYSNEFLPLGLGTERELLGLDLHSHLHTTLMACLTLEMRHWLDVLRNICVTTNVQVLSYVLTKT